MKLAKLLKSPLLVTLTVLLLTAAVASACPMCRDSISNTDAQSVTTVSAGFNNSIYCLLLGFFGALGVVVFNITRAIRKGN